jgi:CheY-like chemotaxis protein
VSALLDLGYAVNTATTADEALDSLRVHSGIGILFSDVMMPGDEWRPA